MSLLFAGYSSLKKLPDISKWDLSKVKNIMGLFFGCSSLKELPDISKWNLSNVIYLSALFYGCSSLKELPDISKWDLSNAIYIHELFFGCSSLKELPDVSKWNLSNVIALTHLFFNCSSLISLPNISKWNIFNPNLNIPSIQPIFNYFGYDGDAINLANTKRSYNDLYFGELILENPNRETYSKDDIQKLFEQNYYDLQGLFTGCSSLKSLPDISSWNIKNSKNIRMMFS